MTPMEALHQHLQVCDDLHALILEENNFLQQNRRAPDAPLLERKRTLLERLDHTLTALRAAPRDGNTGSPWRQALDKTRTRILQILQLDRENEQLLLRCSLATNRTPAAVTAPSVGMLQKIYQRHG